MLIKFNQIKDYEGITVNTIAGCSLHLQTDLMELIWSKMNVES